MRTNKKEFVYRRVYVGQIDAPLMRAILTKYLRDYIPYFQEVYSFIKDKDKDLALNVYSLLKNIKLAIAGIEDILRGTISKEKFEEVLNLTKTIEVKKSEVIQILKETEPLRVELRELEQGVGISQEDLNVTKEIVGRGVKQVKREIKETKRGEISKARAFKAGAVEAIGVSMLGPLYPALETIGGLVKERIGRKRETKEIEEKRIAEGIRRPSQVPFSIKELEEYKRLRFGGRKRAEREKAKQPSKVYSAAERRFGVPTRKETFGVGGPGFGFGKQEAGSLMWFFSEGAYKSKWTKEVLEELRKISKSGAGSASFMDKIGGFLPLLGKAALVAVDIWAIGQVEKLGKGLDELELARKKSRESAIALKKSQGQWIEKIKEEGIETVAAKVGKTPRQLAEDIASREERSSYQKYAARPWWSRVLPSYTPLGASLTMAGGGIPPKIDHYKRVQEIEKLGEIKPVLPPTREEISISSITDPYKRMQETKKYGEMKSELLKVGQISAAIPSVGKIEPPKWTPISTSGMSTEQLKALEDSNKTLNDSIAELANQIKREKDTVSSRQTGGNMYDSADDLLRNHSSGKLTLGR